MGNANFPFFCPYFYQNQNQLTNCRGKLNFFSFLCTFVLIFVNVYVERKIREYK